MLPVTIELTYTGRTGVVVAGAAAPNTAATDLHRDLALWWAQQHAAAYLALPSDKRTRPTAVAWPFLNGSVVLQLAFDYTLLERTLEIYTRFGWPALEAVAQAVARLRDATDETTRLVTITHKVVAVMVANALIEIEQKALAYAQVEWKASRERLTSYLGTFEDRRDAGGSVGITDGSALLDQLLPLFKEFKTDADAAQTYAKALADREAKTPLSKRPPGSGFALWYEVFAAPERELFAKMVTTTKDIARVFPPAVLILGDLPDSLLGLLTPNTKNRIKNEVALQIYDTLSELLTDLTAVEATAANKPATFVLAEQLRPMLAHPRDLSGVGGFVVPDGGCEQSIVDASMSGSKTFMAGSVPVGKIDFQRVMSDPELLARFYNDDHAARTPWLLCVLRQHLDRLDETVKRKADAERAWDAFMKVAHRVAAALALIGLMAIFPFGDAIALPSLVVLLSGVAETAALLGLLMMLNDTFVALAAREGLNAKARTQYFKLAQSDPGGLYEIGSLISRSKALSSSLEQGGLLVILTLPLSRLRVIVAALEFHGAVQNIDVLFAPSDAADGR